MHVIKRLLIVVCLMLMVASAVLAQESEATPSPTLTNAEAIATIEALKSEIEVLAQDVTHDAELIDIRAEDLDGRFSSFESLLSVLGVIAILFGGLSSLLVVVGFWNLSGTQEELNRTKEEAARLKVELDNILENASQQANQISENRKNLQLSNTLQSVAQNQYATGDIAGALKLYERMLKIDPENLWALYMQGYILTKTMGLDDAEEALNKALQIDEKFYYALAARGFIYRRRGDIEEDENDNKAERDKFYVKAADDLNQALNAVNKLVDADGESWWGALGGLHKRQDNIKEAIRCYRKAAAVTPLSSYPMINQAILELKAGETGYLASFKRVAELADREIQAKPEDYWPYGDRMIALLVQGKAEEAGGCFEKLYQLIPKSVEDVLPRIWNTLNDIADDLRARNRVEQADAIEKFMNERLAR